MDLTVYLIFISGLFGGYFIRMFIGFLFSPSDKEEAKNVTESLIKAFLRESCDVFRLGEFSFKVHQKNWCTKFVVSTEKAEIGEVVVTTEEGVVPVKIGQGDYRYLDAVKVLCDKARRSL